MRGMQYQIVLNIIFWPEVNYYSSTNLCVQFLHKTATLIYAVKPPVSRLLRHSWVKGSDAILGPHHKPKYIIYGTIQNNYVTSIEYNLCV